MFLATDLSLQLRIGGFQWFPPVPFPGFRGVGGILLIWSDDSLTPPSSCLGEASKACLTQREAVFHCSLPLCTSEAHTGRSWNVHSQYLEWTQPVPGMEPFAFESRILSMVLFCEISIVITLN